MQVNNISSVLNTLQYSIVHMHIISKAHHWPTINR